MNILFLILNLQVGKVVENNWSKKGKHRELVQIGAYKIHNGEIIDT